VVKKVAKKKGRTKTKRASKKTMRGIEEITITVCGGGMSPIFQASQYPDGLEVAMRQLVEDFPDLVNKDISYRPSE
jgi:hypothetical protein